MFYIDRGRGPALLLIHGMFGDHLDWEPILDPLARRYRVIAVDLPGFGASDKPDLDYTPEYFTRHLIELLCELGIGKATLIGNSFGGQIAMSLALAHPELVAKSILITTGGLHRYSAREINAGLLRLSEENQLRFTPEIYTSLFARLFFKPGAERQRRYIEKQNARLTAADYPDYVRVMRRCIRLSLELCLLDRVGALKMPTLLIHGEHDPVVLAPWVRDAAPYFANGRLVMLECGHVPQLEMPEEVVNMIDDFMVT